MDEEYAIVSVLAGIVSAVVMGVVARKISENKGYEGGFLWGFFLGILGVIIVASKPDNHAGYNQRQMQQGGWRCAKCHHVNPGYVTICSCGLLKTEDALIKYKQLLDSGAISEEEYEAKKKQLLGV